MTLEWVWVPGCGKWQNCYWSLCGDGYDDKMWVMFGPAQDYKGKSIFLQDDLPHEAVGIIVVHRIDGNIPRARVEVITRFTYQLDREQFLDPDDGARIVLWEKMPTEEQFRQIEREFLKAAQEGAL